MSRPSQILFAKVAVLAVLLASSDARAECVTVAQTDENGDTPRSEANLDADGDGVADTRSDLLCRLDTADVDPSYGNFVVYYNRPFLDPTDSGNICTVDADCPVSPTGRNGPCIADPDFGLGLCVTECTTDADCPNPLSGRDDPCLPDPDSGFNVCHMREQINAEAIENLAHYLECAHQFFYGDMNDGMPFAYDDGLQMPVWIIKATGGGGAAFNGHRLTFPVSNRIFNHVRYNTLHELGHQVEWRYSYELAHHVFFVNEGLPTMFEEPLRTIEDGYRGVTNYDRFMDLPGSSLSVMGYEQATPFFGFVANLIDPGPRRFYSDTEISGACSNYLDDIVAEGERFIPFDDLGVTPHMWRLRGREFYVNFLQGLRDCSHRPDGLDVYGDVVCAADDPGETGTAPSRDYFSKRAVNEVMMRNASNVIDETIHNIDPSVIATHRTDGVGDHAMFRMYVEENYLLHAGGALTDSDADGFRLKSFGAHYHEFGLTHEGLAIHIDPESDLTRWAYAAFYIDDSDPTNVQLVPVSGTSGWHEGSGHTTVRIPLDPAYFDAVLMVTEIGGTYDPSTMDEECTTSGQVTVCGHVCTDDEASDHTIIDCYDESGGHYNLTVDSDDDGVLDDDDNCIYIPNRDQANCDADDDAVELVDYGMSGDACDPDLCIDIISEPASSHEFASIIGHHTMWIVGGSSTYRFKAIGAMPADITPDDGTDNRGYSPFSTSKTAAVRMSHCRCDPETDPAPDEPVKCREWASKCLEGGSTWSGWRDSTWTLFDHDHTSTSGAGGSPGTGDLMADILFARPGYHEGENEYSVTWRWREDYPESLYPGLDDIDARIWLRPDPDELRAATGWSETDWPDRRGNTYSGVNNHSKRKDFTVSMPADLIHGYGRDDGIYNPPRAIDLLSDQIDWPDCVPWCDRRDEAFSLPSLMTAGVDFDSPLLESVFALDPNDRSALSAIAVRHQWTGSGFVSEYVPLEFSGDRQLDLQGFSSTVMIEIPQDQNQVEDFNDVLSLWTFGGQDVFEDYHNELWRGVLDRSGNEPVYTFELITSDEGPLPRRGAILMADTSRQQLIMFGGTAHKMFEDIWVFDLQSQQWSQYNSAIPEDVGLVGTASYVVGHEAYLFGGERPDGFLANTLFRFDLHSQEFEALEGGENQPQPSARLGASIVMDGEEDVLYLFGGRDENQQWTNELWAFHLFDNEWEQISQGCEAGPDCPPPARGSTLMQCGASGALTLALGTPADEWKETDHEYRYVTWQDRWVTEMTERGTWEE